MVQDDELNKAEYNQNTGEILNYKDEPKTPKQYAIGGKMGYVGNLERLLDVFTNNEMKIILNMFREHCDENNLLVSKFKDITPKMDPSRRSKFKRKLIENMIIQEHQNRIMMNPYIFRPTSTKHNYQHLTQRLWKYLFVDKDTGSDEVRFHEDDVFGLPDILKVK